MGGTPADKEKREKNLAGRENPQLEHKGASREAGHTGRQRVRSPKTNKTREPYLKKESEERHLYRTPIRLYSDGEFGD